MLLNLTSAPDGRSVLVRSESVIGMEPPFAWSSTIQARVVRLANGQTVLVLDTPDNVTAVTLALTGEGGSVQPAPLAPPDPGGTTNAQ